MRFKHFSNAMLLVASLTGSAWANEWPSNPHVSKDCNEAHEFFLNADYKAMASSAERCLRSKETPKLEAKNILALFDKAYSASSGHLPSDFSLPVGMSDMKLVQRRTDFLNKINFNVELKGKFVKGSQIELLKFYNQDDVKLLDNTDSDYEFEQDDHGYYLKGHHKLPLEEGLYRIKVKMIGGEVINQWVPVVDWVSSKSPEIIAPAHESTVATANPVISWKAFESPNQGYARRSYNARVVRNEAPDYQWDVQWDLYRDARAEPRCIVGRDADGEGVNALQRGRHIAVITYTDFRKYGALNIGKASQVKHTFYVP